MPIGSPAGLRVNITLMVLTGPLAAVVTLGHVMMTASLVAVISGTTHRGQHWSRQGESGFLKQ